jgi:hypothetical protein
VEVADLLGAGKATAAWVANKSPMCSESSSKLFACRL